DIYDFRGDRAFYRRTFGAGKDGFKATRYIADANHTQFNTSWGQMDLSLPRGLCWSRRPTMATEDQRRIAKVYLPAFVDTIFHDKSSYRKLFQDYRYGQDWLPDTTLVSKYRDAAYAPVIQFDGGKTGTGKTRMEGFKNGDVV